MKGWGYPVSVLDNFLLRLFEKYAELLRRRFGDDFQEVRMGSSTSGRVLIVVRLCQQMITCRCPLAILMSMKRSSMLVGSRRTSKERS
jgi:hypothetical protein